MGTVTRNFRLEEELIGDLVFLAEKEKRSLNNFVATKLQLVVDNAKGEKIANSNSSTTTHPLTKDEIKQKYGDIPIPEVAGSTLLLYDTHKDEITSSTSSTELHKAWKRVEANKTLATWQVKQLNGFKELQRTKIDF